MTYGGRFFLVKEKMKGRNSLARCLLGITNESVLRIDEKTKQVAMQSHYHGDSCQTGIDVQVLQVWPLTMIRRWTASRNTFILDLGKHSEDYYCVKTSEGDTISQLLDNLVINFKVC